MDLSDSIDTVRSALSKTLERREALQSFLARWHHDVDACLASVPDAALADRVHASTASVLDAIAKGDESTLLTLPPALLVSRVPLEARSSELRKWSIVGRHRDLLMSCAQCPCNSDPERAIAERSRILEIWTKSFVAQVMRADKVLEALAIEFDNVLDVLHQVASGALSAHAAGVADAMATAAAAMSRVNCPDMAAFDGELLVLLQDYLPIFSSHHLCESTMQACVNCVVDFFRDCSQSMFPDDPCTPHLVRSVLSHVRIWLFDARIAIPNELLKVAVILNDACLVRAVLSDVKVDPNICEGCAIILAAQNGFCASLSALLADARVNPSVQNGLPIRTAVNFGNVLVAKQLLASPLVDPSVLSNEPLRDAVRQRNPHMVLLLLTNPRVVAQARWNDCDSVMTDAIYAADANRSIYAEKDKNRGAIIVFMLLRAGRFPQRYFDWCAKRYFFCMKGAWSAESKPWAWHALPTTATGPRADHSSDGLAAASFGVSADASFDGATLEPCRSSRKRARW